VAVWLCGLCLVPRCRVVLYFCVLEACVRSSQNNLDILDWELPDGDFNALSGLQPQRRMVDGSIFCGEDKPYKVTMRSHVMLPVPWCLCSIAMLAQIPAEAQLEPPRRSQARSGMGLEARMCAALQNGIEFTEVACFRSSVGSSNGQH
jgi:hypothetical protein